MSGFEIAGIVLGAFPLAIEGLKLYEKLARRCEIWRQTEFEYKKCLQELSYHRRCFQTNLQSLLLPLVADKQTVESLIASPNAKEWEDVGLDQALRQRLRDSYELYVDIISSLRSLMADAEKHLGIDSSYLQARLSNPDISNFSEGNKKDKQN